MPRPLSDSFRDAFCGLSHAYRTQRNLRIHLSVATVAVALGLWVRLTTPEWAILSLTIALVVSAELANSALETLADAASPDFHPLVGIAKDVAAGAVLVAALGSVVVGLLLFLPRLLAILGEMH